jgi:hypothetical protein
MNERADKMDMKVKLSMLWIFVTLNYLYADVFTLMDPEALRAIIKGTVGSIQINQKFLLAASLLMEIPIAMVVLSRLLPYKANRWANIIAGAIKTAAVASSMFVGTAPAPYYLFFGAVEVPCTLLIMWYAWKWPAPDSQPQ